MVLVVIVPWRTHTASGVGPPDPNEHPDLNDQLKLFAAIFTVNHHGKFGT